MKVVIAGYTYTRENLFDVFELYPEKENLFFILPNNWKAKRGSVFFQPFTRRGFSIWHSPAFFTHSDYPLIGGLLKGWMPFFLFRLIWLRFVKGADILFTTGEPNLLSTLYNAIWAKLLGMKHIFHFWENIPYEVKDRGFKLWFKKMVIRANLVLSDGALCGMKKAEEILRSFHPRFPIGTFLHAGLNPERFRPGLEPSLQHRLHLEAKTVFLFVGALGYRKGVHVALQALAKIRETHKQAALIVVGSGEYQQELEQLTKELNLSDVVTFVPWMSNEQLPGVYCSADVFLYPSIPYQGWEEQFGYSIAEASLCGLPVISTRSGSVREVLIDGETGIMVEPNDADALAMAMERLIADSELRARLGRQGRTFVQERFGNKIIAMKLFTLFQNVSR